MRGNYWTPMISVSNPTNVGAGNAKLATYGRHVYVWLLQKFLDLVNLFSRQFSMPSSSTSWAGNESIFPSMAHVIQLANPFQVFDAVVRFYAILVINLRQVVGVFNEVEGNKPMRRNAPRFVCASVSELVNQIAIRVQRWFQKFWLGSELPSAQRARQNFASRANLVKTLVPLNVLPDFSFHTA